MLLRALSLVALCLLLSSCQPPTYDIIAHIRGSELVFEVRGSGSWPFRDEDGISAEWLQVRDRDRLVWAIQLDPDRPDCKPRGETPPFPLVFGRLPQCYVEKSAAKPPRIGALHRVDGEGFRSGLGFFVVTEAAGLPNGRTVGNPKWEQVSKEVGRWPILADPRFPPATDAPANAR